MKNGKARLWLAQPDKAGDWSVGYWKSGAFIVPAALYYYGQAEAKKLVKILRRLEGIANGN